MITIEELRKRLKAEAPEAFANWRKEDPCGSDDKVLDDMIIWICCLWDADSYKELMPTDLAEMLRDGIEPKTIESIMDWINSDKETMIETPNDIINHFQTA